MRTMVSKFFLGISLLGAEWVLYVLVAISVLSIALIIDRLLFYKQATKNLKNYRSELRSAAQSRQWDKVKDLTQKRAQSVRVFDFDSSVAQALIQQKNQTSNSDALNEVAQDALIRTRIEWEKHLAVLATIGSNAPFVGLFGTVIGIIQAFHELSQRATGGGAGSQTVIAGISEALIATAVGILVAIPAVVAFNLFQRKVKAAQAEAEALKSFLISQLSSDK